MTHIWNYRAVLSSTCYFHPTRVWCWLNHIFVKSVLSDADQLVRTMIHDTGFQHDDVIKWKHFPRNWPSVRGIHGWPMDSLTNGGDAESFGVFLDLRLNKRLSKQSIRRWCEKLSLSLWRHCNELIQLSRNFTHTYIYIYIYIYICVYRQFISCIKSIELNNR